MGIDIESGMLKKRKILLSLTTICAIFVVLNLSFFIWGERSLPTRVVTILLGKGQPQDGTTSTWTKSYLDKLRKVDDGHPIAKLMKEADERWLQYEQSRSTSFRATVAKYRSKHGRHPPPGFKEWYRYARERHVHNIDDFEQIMDDLRPLWGIEPQVLRQMAAKMSEDEANHMSGIHIRNHTVAFTTSGGWRCETLSERIMKIASYLPDMDIAMNRLDQPRLVVPFEDMQELLKMEVESRQMRADAVDKFTDDLDFLLQNTTPPGNWTEQNDPQWFPWAGKQYMDIGKFACPPESPARNESMTGEEADALYKSNIGGIVTNFNLSSDVCTVGPVIQDKHGLLFSASTMLASKRMLPVFSECKLSVNNDILFPANMYTLPDDRYIYDPTYDLEWGKKNVSMIWRGVTSGGVQVSDNWERMHRQRLVQYTNDTYLSGRHLSIVGQTPIDPGNWTIYEHFQASTFAEQHFDVGFTESWGCIPDCGFYADVFSYKPQVPLSNQFENKFLIDVDGHSFSGRWRAFLQSKSLGIKATIFREWHDSRLFAWRHFVPLDNRYDELYTIMTYLIGTPPGPETGSQSDNSGVDVYVPRHDVEAQAIAFQSRDWAHRVLRDDDISIYLLRLLLEYARVLDDNRDVIGYAGDGSELDAFDKKHPFPATPIILKWNESTVTDDLGHDLGRP